MIKHYTGFGETCGGFGEVDVHCIRIKYSDCKPDLTIYTTIEHLVCYQIIDIGINIKGRCGRKEHRENCDCEILKVSIFRRKLSDFFNSLDSRPYDIF